MHDTDTKRPDRARLVEIATAQHGYFTTSQGKQCGYSRPLLSHHARGGQFTRVRHGLYRLRDFPSSPYEDVMAAWLAAGPDEAVVSHETALDLLDLSDVIPDGIHITVPRSRRWYRPPEGVHVHTTTRSFEPGEVVVREGIRVTSPARTIADAAQSGVSPEQIETAVRQTRERGLTTREQLLEAADARGGTVANVIHEAVERAWGNVQ